MSRKKENDKPTIAQFDILSELSKKFPNLDVRTIVKEYYKLRDNYLLNGYIVKEPIGKSEIVLRRVSSPRAFNVTETSTRSVKVVTRLNQKVSSDVILKSINDEAYSKLLSNGRI